MISKYSFQSPGVVFCNGYENVQSNSGTYYQWFYRSTFMAFSFNGTGCQFNSVVQGGTLSVNVCVDGGSITTVGIFAQGLNNLVTGLSDTTHTIWVCGTSGQIPMGGDASGTANAGIYVTGANPSISAYPSMAAVLYTSPPTVTPAAFNPSIDFSSGWYPVTQVQNVTNPDGYTTQLDRIDGSLRVLGKISDLSVVLYATGGVLNLSIDNHAPTSVTVPYISGFCLLQIATGLDSANLHSYEVSMGVAGANGLYLSAFATSSGSFSTTTATGGVGVNAINSAGKLYNRLRVLGVGDSITAGLTNGNSKYGFLSQLKQNTNLSVLNHGVSGDCLYNVYAALQTDLSTFVFAGNLEPDYILHDYGANDCNPAQGISVAHFQAATLSMANFYHSHFPHATMVWSKIMYRGDVATSIVDTYNAALIVTLSTVLTERDIIFDPQALVTYADFNPDLIHPLPKGNFKIAAGQKIALASFVSASLGNSLGGVIASPVVASATGETTSGVQCVAGVNGVTYI